MIAYWRQSVENQRGLDGEDRLIQCRHLHASMLLDGIVRLDGDLGPGDARELLTALGPCSMRSRAPMGPKMTIEPRPSYGSMRSAIFCRGWLDMTDRPMVGANDLT